jgi:hypothetical protein
MADGEDCLSEQVSRPYLTPISYLFNILYKFILELFFRPESFNPLV